MGQTIAWFVTAIAIMAVVVCHSSSKRTEANELNNFTMTHARVTIASHANVASEVEASLVKLDLLS